MAEWEQFDPSKAYPDYLADLTSGLADVADLLATALDVMATVVEVAGAFVQGFQDAQQALILAIQAAVDSVVQQLTQTGVYWLFHMPPSRISYMPISTWTRDVALSLDDFSDTARPILVDPSAYVGAVVVCATASNYKDLLSDYRSMFEMFKKRIADANQMYRWPDREDPWEVVEGVGRVPDWGSKKLGDIIPPINDLAKKMLAFSDSLSSGYGGTDLYQLFADQLFAKSAYLTDFSNQVLAILTLLENLLNWEGAYVLPIYGQGDAAWVQSILRTSRGGPWDDTDARFTAGAVFLATGGTSAQADLLFDLFKLPKVVSEVPEEIS